MCGAIGDMLMPGYPIIPNMFTCYCDPKRVETHIYYYAFLQYFWQLNYITEKNYAILYSSGGEKNTWELPFIPIVCYGDFDGDGICDFTNGINTFSFNNAITSSDYLVKSITDNAINESVNVNYSYASNKTIHTQGSGATFPYNDFAGSIPLVSSVETPDGIGGKNKTEYSYSGLTMHRQGRGLLGFKNITSKNATQGIKSTTHYKETSSVLKSWLPYRTDVATIDGSKISIIGKKYAYKYPVSGRTFGYDYVECDTLRNYVENKCYYTNNIYDQYGNMTYSNIYYPDSYRISQSINNTYETKGSWCPSKLKTTNYSSFDYTKAINYEYDNLGNLLKIIEYPGKPKALTTTYVPNIYGLPSSVAISATGETSRTKSFSYDSKFRFVTGTQNGLGQSIELKHDAFGRILKEKNTTAGIEKEMEYDPAGWLKKITDYSGNITSFYMKKAESNAPQHAKYYTLAETPGVPYSKIYYDLLGRAIKTEMQGFDSKIFTEKIYNAKGLLEKESDPYKSTPVSYTNYEYDKFRRIQKIQNQQKIVTYNHGGEIRITSGGKDRWETIDDMGYLEQVEDDNGQVISYTYDGLGQLKTVIHNSKTLVSINYDEYGRQKTLTDIDAGTITYDYNAFGELVKQTDAKGNTFTSKYDNLGRITEQYTASQGTTYYNYYTDINNAYHGLLKSVSGPDNMQQKYEYDKFGRIVTYTDVVMGEEFKTKYGYDSYGNVILNAYPSGFTVENRYNKAGYLYNILNVADAKSIWKLQETDANGSIRKVLNGNGLQTEYNYDSYSELTEIKTGNIQHLTYKIDPVSHSLISERKDMKKSMTENFQYDNLNRLYSIKLNNGAEKLTRYEDNGNISYKYDAGSYFYNPQKIHAVNSIQGNSINLSGQEITYNAQNKTSSISQGNISYDFKYGADGQRRKMYRKLSGNTSLERTYSLNYERDRISSGTKETFYIPTPSGLSAVFIKENGNAGNMYYLCSDHLGSITAISDANGQVKESFSYDSWGRRRNAGNWNDYNVATSNSLLSRGYTGHEHLDDVGLINMNGRMYDPLLGRMLGPDNLIPDPFSLQGYNRYSYCHNNPMMFIDPDGENPVAWALAGLIYIGKLWSDGKKANGGESNPVKWDWKHANYTIGYSSQGNTVYGGVGWSNDYGVAVGYGFNNKQWQGGALVQGEPVMVPFRQTQLKPNEIECGPGMAYSTAYAKQFADEYFWKGIINRNEIFADGTLPPTDIHGYYSIVGDHVYAGYDETYGTHKNGVIYLYKGAFTSKEELYLNFGHEYLHKAIRSQYPNINPHVEHATIYTWEYNQAAKWGASIQQERTLKKYNEYKNYYNPQYNYEQFNFRIKSKRPWKR